MADKRKYSKLSTFFLLLCLTHAHGLGVWHINVDELDAIIGDLTFSPDFIIARVGGFDDTGVIKYPGPLTALQEACGKKVPIHSWMYYEIPPEKPVTTKAGRLLGAQINQDLFGTCFNVVHIDIEPLFHPPPWLVPFLEAVKSKLTAEKTELFFDIPAVTDLKLRSYNWNKEEAKSILKVADGISIMLWDTGLSEVPKYERVLRDSVEFAIEAHKEFPKKTILFSLPAYVNGIANYHFIPVENLRVVKNFLPKLPIEKAKIFCSDRVPLSITAWWQMTSIDKITAKEIRKWQTDLCKLR